MRPSRALISVKEETGRVLKVAGLVIERRGFDREANMRELEQLTAQAVRDGARLLVTPECFLDGYIAQTKGMTREQYAQIAEKVPDGNFCQRIRRIAERYSVYLAAGLTEADGERFYNTCVLIGPDGTLIGKYRKSHTLDDEPLNSRGDEFPVFDTPLGRIGIMICYDRQPPEVARLLALHGAEIILNPAAGSYGETNTMIVRTRAYENGVPIVFSHFAECLIVTAQGNIAERYQDGGTRAVVGEVRTGKVRSTLDCRRPEMYGDLCTGKPLPAD